MWSNTYAQWRATVVEHYGSIEAFHDTSTIRIQHQTARIKAQEADALFADVAGSAIEHHKVVDDFRAERTALTGIIDELQAWLDARGLAPEPLPRRLA